jgi:hypothetical protein
MMSLKVGHGFIKRLNTIDPGPLNQKSEDMNRYRYAAFVTIGREFSYRVDMKYLRPAGQKAAVVVHHVRQMFPIHPANSGLL